MHHGIQFLTRYGAPLLFASVLTEQMGLPIPSLPILLAMGALVGAGGYSFAGLLGLAVTAAMIADFTWYNIGQSKGHSVLKLLCRISLEPDSCVSNTRYWFRKMGAWALVVAKFVPGLSTVATPMSGLSRMPVWKFLLADFAGSTLWASVYLGLGHAFRSQLEKLAAVLARLGGGMLFVVIGLLALWICGKYWQRRRFIKSLRIARLTPEELKDRAADFVIIDLRSPEEVAWDGKKLPGAIWIDRRVLAEHSRDIPRDREVVLYCSCPNEVTSARAALQLRKVGITRVHPLEGGYEAWRERGYELEDAGKVERA